MTAGSAAAATVYKWTDANGVVHYSDQPNPRAQAVEVQAAQSYGKESGQQQASAAPTSDAPAGPAPPPYSECVMYQPENEKTFPNTSVISGSIRMSPSLLPGHKVSVALDGRRQGPSAVVTQSGFTIRDVERGAHTLFFVIEDAQGKVVCQSETVTVYVTQPTLLSPLRRGR